MHAHTRLTELDDAANALQERELFQRTAAAIGLQPPALHDALGVCPPQIRGVVLHKARQLLPQWCGEHPCCRLCWTFFERRLTALQMADYVVCDTTPNDDAVNATIDISTHPRINHE